MIVFCVVFCRSVIVLFLLAIVLPALALGDLKTLLALFLKQKRVRKFTWLDPIQFEKNMCTIFNWVQFSLKTRVQFYVIKTPNEVKKKHMLFYIAIAGIGPKAIGYDCYRSL